MDKRARLRTMPGRVGVATVAVVALTLAAAAQAGKVYYRYQNDRGVTVQTDRLPPEVVPRGYQVVSASGDVIKVVPRQLTAEELQARDAAAEQQRLAEAEAERVRKWDQSLFIRYSNVAEIEEAKLRGLREFDTRIGILQGNLMSLKGQIESEQGDAANYTRRGREVPEALTKRIDSLKAEVRYAESAIDALQRERVETEQQFERDIARFEFLLEQAALQR